MESHCLRVCTLHVRFVFALFSLFLASLHSLHISGELIDSVKSFSTVPQTTGKYQSLYSRVPGPAFATPMRPKLNSKFATPTKIKVQKHLIYVTYIYLTCGCSLQCCLPPHRLLLLASISTHSSLWRSLDSLKTYVALFGIVHKRSALTSSV